HSPLTTEYSLTNNGLRIDGALSTGTFAGIENNGIGDNINTPVGRLYFLQLGLRPGPSVDTAWIVGIVSEKIRPDKFIRQQKKLTVQVVSDLPIIHMTCRHIYYVTVDEDSLADLDLFTLFRTIELSHELASISGHQGHSRRPLGRVYASVLQSTVAAWFHREKHAREPQPWSEFFFKMGDDVPNLVERVEVTVKDNPWLITASAAQKDAPISSSAVRRYSILNQQYHVCLDAARISTLSSQGEV
ncbi:hypothetical protein B0T22DRAFT_445170, partial [Podospora appendiculata]